MKDTVTIPNCLNIFGSYMRKEKNIKLSGVLLERLIIVLVLIFASYVKKYFILNALGDCRLLNKKSEFVNKCRHENKLLLSNIKDSKD